MPNLERRWRETDSSWVREELGRYQSETPCEVCHGLRLKPEALAVKIAGANIGEVSNFLDPPRTRMVRGAGRPAHRKAARDRRGAY